MVSPTLATGLIALVGVATARTYQVAYEANTFPLRLVTHNLPTVHDGFKFGADLKYVKQTGYIANVTFGHDSFDLVVDTGSSDTWALSPTLPGASTPVPDSVLNASYVDGTNILGTFVRTNVWVNDTCIANDQIVGIGTNLTLPDGLTNSTLKGILGLCYPYYSYYRNTKGEKINYDPIMATAGKQTNLKTFSIVMEKETGILAFGGYPAGSIDGEFTHTSVLPLTISQNSTSAKREFKAFNIKHGFSFKGAEEIEGTAINGTHTNNTYFSIIDSGTDRMYVPARISEAVGKLYDPPAVSYEGGNWQLVQCNATTPYFAFNISGTDFPIPAEDMMYKHPATGRCWSTIVGYQGSLPVDECLLVGQAFMRHVVTMHDLEKNELAFAKKRV